MKIVNTTVLSLALLCSYAHIFANEPKNPNDNPQQQREQEALEGVMREFEARLSRLGNMVNQLPTPDHFGRVLASRLNTLNNLNNLNTNLNQNNNNQN